MDTIRQGLGRVEQGKQTPDAALDPGQPATRTAQPAIGLRMDLPGHLVWSLLNNDEWDKDYRRRFGLLYTDCAVRRRAHARWFADVVRRYPLDGDG